MHKYASHNYSLLLYSFDYRIKTARVLQLISPKKTLAKTHRENFLRQRFSVLRDSEMYHSFMIVAILFQLGQPDQAICLACSM